MPGNGAGRWAGLQEVDPGAAVSMAVTRHTAERTRRWREPPAHGLWNRPHNLLAGRIYDVVFSPNGELT